MKFWLLAAGKLRAGPMKDLAADYTQRITLPLTLVEIDIRARRGGAAAEEIEERYLKALPEGAHVILLDEGGTAVSSLQFAGRLQKLRDAGETDNLALIIGGPDGHGPRIRALARETLAFGRATWPHMLARVMLLEQIYRAQSIWAGSPYHRE